MISHRPHAESARALIRSSLVRLAFGAMALFLGPNVTYAMSIPIDLTPTTGGFVVSDPAAVSSGPEINKVVLDEDPVFGVTFIANDPVLGDPGVSVPLLAESLLFDYEFSTSGDDNFSVTLLGGIGGSALMEWLHDGTAMGPGSYFGVDIEFDLVALGVQGEVIGLEFLLNSNLGDTTLDATVAFSNVRFDIPTAMPIGATSWLLLPLVLLVRRFNPRLDRLKCFDYESGVASIKKENRGENRGQTTVLR